MAGNIKGLTVEIGGDTTKLGKALENVQKRSKSLSGELGHINRLLKMDPGNTDLLAQKQKVLAEAIENTTGKLKTLKTAEKQVQQQFERGEVSEEQVRALQREIIATEKKLDSYKNAAKETEDAIRGVGEESEKTEKDSRKLGETLGSAVKTGFAAVAAVAAAAVAGLTAAAESTREYRTEMGKLNAAYTASDHSTKTAAAAYKTLVGVIGETDQSVEAAQQIALLADSEKEVTEWSNLAAGVVGKFGDALQPETFYEAANETLKLGESTGAFTQMLEGCGINVEQFNKNLAACATTEEKQAYMLEVTEGALGKAGEAYKENNADIIAANQANDNWMQSLSGIGAAVEPIITTVKNMGASLLSDAVPGVQKLAEAFQGLMTGNAGASGDFAAGQLVTQLVQGISTQLPVLVSKGGEMLGKLGEGIKNAMPGLASKGIDILMGLATSLYNAAPKLIDAGFGFIKNLVQGLMNSLPTLLEKGPELVSKFANIINHNVPRILKHGMDLVITIVKGIIAAIPTLVKNIPKIIQAIVDVWQAFNWMNLGKKAFTMLKNGLTSMGGALKSAGQKAGQWITDALKSLPGKLLNLGKTALTGMRNGITSMAGAIRAAGGRILTVIINAVKALPGRLLTMGRNAITFLGNAISNGVGIVRAKATNLVSSVVNVVKGLPGKIASVGSQLVQGIWKGISASTTWIKNKIKGWVGDVTSFLKRLFGIESPSKLMADEIGRWLPPGIAAGVDRNAKIATNAMARLSDDMVDAAEPDIGGLGFERSLTARRSNAVFGGATSMMDGSAVLAALDRIYDRLNRLQVVLDSGALVGGTIDMIDAGLATRQILRARGV